MIKGPAGVKHGLIKPMNSEPENYSSIVQGKNSQLGSIPPVNNFHNNQTPKKNSIKSKTQPTQN